MANAKTAGQRLRSLLDEGLPTGIVWKASEKAALGLIEQAADRVETLKGLLAAELNGTPVSAHRCCELSGEIRVSELAIAKLIGTLDPEMTQATAKSARHQRAANARWSGAGLGGPA